MSQFLPSAARQVRRDHDQVVGDDAPADPVRQASLAAITAAVQRTGSTQLTDPTFDASAKPHGSAKPRLRFMDGASFILVARLRQAHKGDDDVTRHLLIRGREDPACGGSLPRRMMAVCGSNRLTYFSAACRLSPSKTRRLVCVMTRRTSGRECC